MRRRTFLSGAAAAMGGLAVDEGLAAVNERPGRQTSPAGGATNVSFTGEPAAPAESLTLWYRRPADRWLQALPLGNGRLGAMVFGGVPRERVQLNEKSLWAGGPRDTTNPEAKRHLE